MVQEVRRDTGTTGGILRLAAIERHLTRPVPRYTSYPTAPHFHDGIDAAAYAGWLGKLDPAHPISLYLHVPFCRKLCWYCGCNMKLAVRDEPLETYSDALLKEIDLVAARLPARMKVDHLHWGGGTPTVLKPDLLERLMGRLRRCFDITSDAELAIEADPRTLKQDMVRNLAALGFNRSSFGVQEFDPKVQAAINRVQPAEMVERCVDMLRDHGISAINFDLIYGLPHQTVESLVRTIDRSADMAPDRVALFGYAHVPWMAKKQRLIDEAALPGAGERLAQATGAAGRLAERGYQAIGIDHFARPEDPLAAAAGAGTLRRNFQGYTTDAAATLIGLGATSIGRTPDGFVQNRHETGAWMRAVEEGRLPVAKGHAFGGDDLLRASVIEKLMCFGTVDLDAEATSFGYPPDWLDDDIEALQPLLADGIVRIDGRSIALAPGAGVLTRLVAAAFDAYLTPPAAGSGKRHSVAV